MRKICSLYNEDMRKQVLNILSLLLLLLTGCQSRPQNAVTTDQLPEIYPDYTEVTIPTDIAPLNFTMTDDEVTTMDVTVKGAKGGELHTNDAFADEWGITYRRIPPSYQIYSKMGLYQRCLATFEEKAMLKNTQINGMCINCHTPNKTNPDQYVFHARGANGATIIHRKGKDELLQAKNEFLGGSMVYPYWHPKGRYCAFSTNATSQMFHFANKKRIEVYDSKSDVFVYDTETHTILRDTQVDTLVRAAQTGKSVTWPRPSYDGRYIMYTLADYGYFSIWHPEADLWLLDLQTGETQPLTTANSEEAESFHNWTGNSHWFLFTSRRDDGLYSRIYLSSIEGGKATKPFILPQRDPKRYYRELLDSYNTPDFTSRPVDTDARLMGKEIESNRRIITKTK